MHHDAGRFYSGKRYVTTWRPSVCSSVCLSRWHTHHDLPWGVWCDAASEHFGPTI